MKNKSLIISLLLGTMTIGTYTACDNHPQEKEMQAINLADMDTTVNPGVDFDAYANGGWKKHHPLPADRARYGIFDQLAELAEKQLNELI